MTATTGGVNTRLRYFFLDTMKLILFLIFFATSTTLFALEKGHFATEIADVILDKSFSALAKDFYIGFAQVWANKNVNTQYSVVLSEDMSAYDGNRVLVSCNQNVIFTAKLNRRADNISKGRLAAEYVIEQLSTFKVNHIKSPDLADDEF